MFTFDLIQVTRPLNLIFVWEWIVFSRMVRGWIVHLFGGSRRFPKLEWMHRSKHTRKQIVQPQKLERSQYLLLHAQENISYSCPSNQFTVTRRNTNKQSSKNTLEEVAQQKLASSKTTMTYISHNIILLPVAESEYRKRCRPLTSTLISRLLFLSLVPLAI